jgi:hypothetical protein
MNTLRRGRWFKVGATVVVLVFVAGPLLGQGKRLWVLRAPGEMVEFNPVTFEQKQAVKVPVEALKSPQNLSVNGLGQMLFAPTVALPLDEDDPAMEQKVWLWDGHAANSINREVTRGVSTTGSNLEIAEKSASPALSQDGTHLYWFSNDARRLQRDDVDLSTRTTWRAWRTDLAGGGREEVTSTSFPECRCTTGSCEETCPYGQTWVPDNGVANFFLLTQFVAGQAQPTYKASSRYEEHDRKWASDTIDTPLRRILDAADANTVLEGIPDTGCCGWANKSDDQTLLRLKDKTLTIFDERAQFNNPDYDVSFYTQNGKLSPDVTHVATTIVATAGPNRAIQLTADGQASPEELQSIRKALAELPAVEVKSVEDSPRRTAYLPHAEVVGWLSEKEILIIEDHVLATYNLATGVRHKSSVRVDDLADVYLR